MASKRQVEAARRNVKKAQAAARKGAQRHGTPGHALEDRNRQQLYEIAKRENIAGRSRMGKWDLIEAIRRKR
jgi:hypothetical protein